MSFIHLLLLIFSHILRHKLTSSIDCNEPRDNLITGPTPNKTILIQSILLSSEWNNTFDYFGLKWSQTQGAIFKNVYLKNITETIENSKMSIDEKHKQIYEAITLFLEGYTNKTWMLCIPFGEWGIMRDYLKCRS